MSRGRSIGQVQASLPRGGHSQAHLTLGPGEGAGGEQGGVRQWVGDERRAVLSTLLPLLLLLPPQALRCWCWQSAEAPRVAARASFLPQSVLHRVVCRGGQADLRRRPRVARPQPALHGAQGAGEDSCARWLPAAGRQRACAGRWAEPAGQQESAGEPWRGARPVHPPTLLPLSLQVGVVAAITPWNFPFRHASAAA